MTAGDADGVARLYEALSTDDRRLRFFTAFHPDHHWCEQWASIGERGGFGFVATAGDDIVGDVGCTPLPNGNVEAAFTVAPGWRGGLGTKLFDTAVAAAKRRHVLNLELEVLLENNAMIGLIRKHRFGVLVHGHSIARFVVGTRADGPAWAPLDPRQRVLVEIAGGWWGGEAGLDEDEMQVVVCPGPAPGRRCPATEGKECRLAHDADVLVFRLRSDKPETDAIRAAHWLLHPRPQIVSDLRAPLPN